MRDMKRLLYAGRPHRVLGLVAQSCPTLCNPIDYSLPASASVHGISCRELPFPSPGDLPDPGIKPASLVSPALQAASSPLRHWLPWWLR